MSMHMGTSLTPRPANHFITMLDEITKKYLEIGTGSAWKNDIQRKLGYFKAHGRCIIISAAVSYIQEMRVTLFSLLLFGYIQLGISEVS